MDLSLKYIYSGLGIPLDIDDDLGELGKVAPYFDYPMTDEIARSLSDTENPPTPKIPVHSLPHPSDKS